MSEVSEARRAIQWQGKVRSHMASIVTKWHKRADFRKGMNNVASNKWFHAKINVDSIFDLESFV